MKPAVSVVIPAYNEEANLEYGVTVILEKLSSVKNGVEILIVNDCSQDSTGELADKLSSQHLEVHAVHHPQNLGIGGAFVTGVTRAIGEWIILIPADLALHPDEIDHYLASANDADIVVGMRSDRSDYTLLRKLVSYTNIRLIQLLFGMELQQFQYISMYHSRIFEMIEIEYWHSAFFLAEILIKAKALGASLVPVKILYAPRLKGKPTGAKFALILRTGWDMIRFWLRWNRYGSLKASQKTGHEHRKVIL